MLTLLEPGFVEWLEKELPYKLPKPYPLWRKVLEQGAITLLASHSATETNDYSLHSHAESWRELVHEKTPLYCISKDIIRDFQQTDITEGEPFFPKDWIPKILRFVAVFPDSVIKDCENNGIVMAFVEAFSRVPKDLAMFSKGVMITAINQKGIIYSTAFGIGDAGELLINPNLMAGSCSMTPEEGLFLQDFRSIIIQSILCLEFVPQYVEEPPAPRASSNPKAKAQHWNPRMLGRTYVRRIKPPAPQAEAPRGTNRSPRTHQRAAFWRSQACGKNFQDRVQRWILSTTVPKDKNGN